MTLGDMEVFLVLCCSSFLTVVTVVWRSFFYGVFLHVCTLGLVCSWEVKEWWLEYCVPTFLWVSKHLIKINIHYFANLKSIQHYYPCTLLLTQCHFLFATWGLLHVHLHLVQITNWSVPLQLFMIIIVFMLFMFLILTM